MRLILPLFLAEVLLGSWNLKWFPSGRAEHRAKPEVEERHYEAAANVIGETIKPRTVVFLQELRSAETASNLAARVGLNVAAVSAWRTYDGRLGWQQCAILTDLPVKSGEWHYARPVKGMKGKPPRGYVRAIIDGGEDGELDCICVHLKSNYGAGSDPAAGALNRRKREEAVRQLPKDSEVAVIAGDFNFDCFADEFAGEETADILVWSGFVNCWAGVEFGLRGTHPGNTRWPDSTLDYIFTKGLKQQGAPSLGARDRVSDHRMVWLKVSRD